MILSSRPLISTLTVMVLAWQLVAVLVLEWQSYWDLWEGSEMPSGTANTFLQMKTILMLYSLNYGTKMIIACFSLTTVWIISPTEPSQMIWVISGKLLSFNFLANILRIFHPPVPNLRAGICFWKRLRLIPRHPKRGRLFIQLVFLWLLLLMFIWMMFLQLLLLMFLQLLLQILI